MSDLPGEGEQPAARPCVWQNVVLLLVLATTVGVVSFLFVTYHLDLYFIPLIALPVGCVAAGYQCHKRAARERDEHIARFTASQQQAYQARRVSALKSTMDSVDKWLASAEQYNFGRQLAVEEECGVCFETKPSWSLACGHRLCKTCCVRVLESNQTCPFDRKIISQAPVRVFHQPQSTKDAALAAI
ncbi:hypothetical protein BASA81_008005 [Batrachochytrium salamandrivorans]|nr:hypothetical protein BASA81_008005 [Batrachochytrium salamandrivorans]